MPSLDVIMEIPKFETSAKKFQNILEQYPSQPNSNVDDCLSSEESDDQSCEELNQQEKRAIQERNNEAKQTYTTGNNHSATI